MFVGSWAILVTLCISSLADTLVQEAPLLVVLNSPLLTPPAKITFPALAGAISTTKALVLPPKLVGPLLMNEASGALKLSPPSILIFAFLEFLNSNSFSSKGIRI